MARTKMNKTMTRLFTPLHGKIVKLSGGRIGGTMQDGKIVVLTTTGRNSGDPHTVPLLYLSEGDRLIVFASWGGRDSHPHWYGNLVANPEASVELPTIRREVVAKTLSGPEREEWWARAVDAYDGYATYQSRTEREIPVVALDPSSG